MLPVAPYQAVRWVVAMAAACAGLSSVDAAVYRVTATGTGSIDYTTRPAEIRPFTLEYTVDTSVPGTGRIEPADPVFDVLILNRFVGAVTGYSFDYRDDLSLGTNLADGMTGLDIAVPPDGGAGLFTLAGGNPLEGGLALQLTFPAGYWNGHTSDADAVFARLEAAAPDAFLVSGNWITPSVDAFIDTQDISSFSVTLIPDP